MVNGYYSIRSSGYSSTTFMPSGSTPLKIWTDSGYTIFSKRWMPLFIHGLKVSGIRALVTGGLFLRYCLVLFIEKCEMFHSKDLWNYCASINYSRMWLIHSLSDIDNFRFVGFANVFFWLIADIRSTGSRLIVSNFRSESVGRELGISNHLCRLFLSILYFYYFGE